MHSRIPARKILFVLLAVFSFLLTNRHQWAADIRNSGDDTVYLSYSMTMGMDLDLDFSNEISSNLYLGPNGRSPRGFYGAGLMAAPFVGLFSLLDRAFDNPVIENRGQFLHSWSYFGFSFAVHFYFLLSILLFWKSTHFFNERPSRLHVLLLLVSSGVLYFVLIRPRMPHAFEFFTLSLVTYSALNVWASFKLGRLNIHWVAVAAFGVNLCVAVRMNDANVVLLPILVFLLHICLEKGGVLRAAERERLLRALGIYLLLVAVFFAPFALLNHAIYDSAIPTQGDIYGKSFVLAYAGEPGGMSALIGKWVALLPNTVNIFFGAEFGLLYSSPVVVIGLFAILFMLAGRIIRAPSLFPLITLAAVIVYVLFSLSFVLLWESTASSYGYRYLYPLFPIAYVGYLLWWLQPDEAQPRQRKATVRLVHAACLALCVFSLLGQALFSKSEKLSYQTGMNSTGRRVATAPDFNKNLTTEIFSVKVWNKALKDGVFGFVNKMYVNRTYLRWKYDQIFFDGERGAREPNWQHPPIVTPFVLILASMWFIFFRLFINPSLRHRR